MRCAHHLRVCRFDRQEIASRLRRLPALGNERRDCYGRSLPSTDSILKRRRAFRPANARAPPQSVPGCRPELFALRGCRCAKLAAAMPMPVSSTSGGTSRQRPGRTRCRRLRNDRARAGWQDLLHARLSASREGRRALSRSSRRLRRVRHQLGLRARRGIQALSWFSARLDLRHVGMSPIRSSRCDPRC